MTTVHGLVSVLLGAGLGVQVFLSFLVAPAVREPSPLRWGTVVLLGITLAGTVYAGHVLLPQAHAARLRAQAAPAGDLAPLDFARLHRLAVAVNIAVFATG